MPINAKINNYIYIQKKKEQENQEYSWYQSFSKYKSLQTKK